MNNETALFSKFILYFALVIIMGQPSLAKANSLERAFKIKPFDLTYFRVYRSQPGWWLDPHRPHGPTCRKSCVYSKYGALVRCQKTCAY